VSGEEACPLSWVRSQIPARILPIAEVDGGATRLCRRMSSNTGIQGIEDEGHTSFPRASPGELRLVPAVTETEPPPRTTRQGRSASGWLSGAPCVVHRLVTTWGEPLPDVASGAKAPRRHASPSDVGASRRNSDRAVRRWKAPRVPADLDPLRGESGEAALGPGCSSGLRKRTDPHPSRAGVSAPRKRRAGASSGPPASRKRAMRGPHEPDALHVDACVYVRVCVTRRVRAVGSSETHRPAPLERRRSASRSTGLSSRCSRGSATRGVRVDRVGAKLRHRARVRASSSACHPRDGGAT